MSTTIEAPAIDWVGKPRPTRHHKQVQKLAAERLLPNVLRWLRSACEQDITDKSKADVLRDLIENFDDEGYRFAHNLDRAGWSPDADLVEILSGASTWHCEKKCVQEWMKANGIAPKLAVGDKVVIPAKWAKDRGHETAGNCIGEITKVDDDGRYIVLIEALGHVREGLGTHGYVEPWEKVEAFARA